MYACVCLCFVRGIVNERVSCTVLCVYMCIEIERITPQHHDNSGVVSDPLSLIVCDLVTGDALWRQEEGHSHGNHFWICPLCNSWIPPPKGVCVCVWAYVYPQVCFFKSKPALMIGIGYNMCELCRYLWIRHHRSHNRLAFDVLK